MAPPGDDSLHDVPNAGDAAEEQRLLELLTSYDDAIVDGTSRIPADDLGEVDANLVHRLRRGEAVVALLAHAAATASDADMTRTPVDSTSLKRIGRFEIIRELGRGGLGVVFLAHDPVLKRKVALKLPRPEALLSDELRRRFLREAQAVARLTHPNLVPVFETAEAGPLVYLAADYVEGPTLASWLAEHGVSTPAVSAQWIAVLAEAVHYAHTQGVLHRDITPKNIILARSCTTTEAGASPASPDNLTPKLVDFGLARVEGSNTFETQSGTAMGTLGYIAPEQAQGQLDAIGPRTDVYALGAVLYHLLTGKPPYSGPSTAVSLSRLLSGDLPPPRRINSAISRDLEAICQKCVEHQPARRYATAAELAADLRRFLAAEPTVARPLNPAQRLVRWVRRRPAAATSIAVTCLAGMTILGGSLWYSWQLSDALNTSEERRQEAVAIRSEAETQRHLATVQRDSNEELLYASRMRLANQLLAQGEIDEATRLLARYEDGSPVSKLRGFEWHYLRRMLHGERLTLAGHRGQVYAVTYSPDGKLVISGGEDGTIRIWDARSGRELQTIEAHASCTNDLVFSPDGQWLASASCDKSVKLWDPQAWTVEHVLAEPTSQVGSLAFSPDGRYLAAGGKDGLVCVWLLAEGRLLERLQTDPAIGNSAPPPGGPSVDVVRFSPDGKLLAASVGTRCVCLWDTATWQSKVAMPLPSVALAFTPDSKRVVVSDPFGAVSIHDLATATKQSSFKGHIGQVPFVGISPDGHELVTAGGNGTSIVWDLDSAIGDPVERTIVGGPDRGARILVGHTARVQAAAFSPDALALATASFDGTVRIWTLSGGDDSTAVMECPVMEERPLGILEVLSPDLTSLTVLESNGKVAVWDVPSRRQVATHQVAGSGRVVISPNSLQVVTAVVGDAGFELSDIDAVALRKPFAQSFGALFAAAFSPSGRSLAAIGENGDLVVCDVSTRTERFKTNVIDPKIVGDRHPIAAGQRPFCFLGEDRLLVIASRERIYFDLPSGKQTKVRGHDVDQVAGLVASPDSQVVAALYHTPAVDLIDGQSGQRRHLLNLPEAVSDAAFSPDGKTLVTGSSAGRFILWHVPTGQELLTLQTPPGEVLALRFSEDGRALAALIATKHGTGSLYAWSVGQVPSGD